MATLDLKAALKSGGLSKPIAAPVPTPTPRGGQVLGASSKGVRQYSSPIGPQMVSRYNTSGPISGGGGIAPATPAPAPAPTPNYAPSQSEIDQTNQLIDQSYNPAYQHLNDIEAQYRQEFPTAQAAIDQQAQHATTDITNEQNTNLAGLTKQRQTAQNEQTSQIAKARQLANELKQGNLTRFGGSSSTGDAANELLNRTTASQFGDINKNFSDLQQQIAQEESNTNNFYTSKLNDLKKNQQLQQKQLKDQFDAKIREINGNRAALDSEKAAKRLGALQELSSAYRQMNYEAQTYAQQLADWKAYKDQAVQMAKDFHAKSFTIPGFNSKFGNFGAIQVGGVNGGGGGGGGGFNPLDMQGIVNNVPEGYSLSDVGINAAGKPSYNITKNKDDELLKAINAITGQQ